MYWNRQEVGPYSNQKHQVGRNPLKGPAQKDQTERTGQEGGPPLAKVPVLVKKNRKGVVVSMPLNVNGKLSFVHCGFHHRFPRDCSYGVMETPQCFLRHQFLVSVVMLISL